MHGIPGLSGITEEVRKWFSAASESNQQLQGLGESLKSYQEQAISLAREGVRNVRTSVAHMEHATAEQLEEAKAALAVAEDRYRTYETIFFDHLKRTSVDRTGFLFF